jgi:hypothetical protein
MELTYEEDEYLGLKELETKYELDGVKSWNWPFGVPAHPECLDETFRKSLHRASPRKKAPKPLEKRSLAVFRSTLIMWSRFTSLNRKTRRRGPKPTGMSINDISSLVTSQGQENGDSIRRQWLRMKEGHSLNPKGEALFRDMALLPYWYNSRRDRSGKSLIEFYSSRLSDSAQEIMAGIDPVLPLTKGQFPSIFLPEILIDLLEITERYKPRENPLLPPSPLDMTALLLMLSWIDTQLCHYQSNVDPPTKGMLSVTPAQFEVPGDATTQSVLFALSVNGQSWMVLHAFVSSLARHLYLDLRYRLTSQATGSKSSTTNFALLHGLLYGQSELVMVPDYALLPASDGYYQMHADIDRCKQAITHIINTIPITTHANTLSDILSLYGLTEELGSIRIWLEQNTLKLNKD